MSPAFSPDIWLLDDTDHWHEITRITVEQWGQGGFHGFFTSAGLLAALNHTSLERYPLCILMDFYISHERGDRVTEYLMQSFDEQLVIIGYSTATYGSQAIVCCGGYDMVRKHNDARGINPSLLDWLQTEGNRLLA